MKTSATMTTLFGCAVFFLLSTPAQAGGPELEESIEWVLANSDRVFVGKILKVDKITGTDSKDYQLATVAISKTMKGERADRVTFLLRHYIFTDYANQWREEGIPMLFFLVQNDGKRIPVPAKKVTWVLREYDTFPSAILLGKSKHKRTGSITVLTRKFEVLTDKAAILKFVEQTVKATAKDPSPRSHTLIPPENTPDAWRELFAHSSVDFKVPIDKKLEVLGRLWCKSASPWVRREGSRILRHFKNEKNVDILKSLLDDPSTAEAHFSRSVPNKRLLELVWRKNLYYVRQAAFDSLREQGVEVDKPVLEVLLEGRDEPFPYPTKKELEKEIKGLIKKINVSDPLEHGGHGYTPAVDRLIKIGIPSLLPCLDAIADGDEDTRDHAALVIGDIMSKLHGFVPGKGYPDEEFGSSQMQKDLRALILSLGYLRNDDPPEKRAQAIVKWRKWIKEEGYKKIKVPDKINSPQPTLPKRRFILRRWKKNQS